jgi:glycosyltransferase involved in cell wall biosynthesis
MTAPALWALLGVRSLPRGRRPALITSERGEVIATTRRQAWMQRFVCRGSDAVTANAEVAQRAIVSRLGIPAARVHYVPNGIDLDAWDRAAEEPCPLRLEVGCFHLALVGRLELEKNHALLIEALRRIEPRRRASWRTWFVGDERVQALAARLREQVVAAGLAGQVHFAGRTPAIAALMRDIDCLVLPSLHEGFPNVVLEAMASRLPVVASRVGAVPQLVEDGRTGFVFASEDPDALGLALVRASELSSAEREVFGKRAREVVERRYTIAATAELYERLYEAALRARADAQGRAAPRRD